MTIRRKRRILATSVFPSASGPIHFGHLLTHIQCDIWVRFQRLVGNQCLHISGADSQGTAMVAHADADDAMAAELIEQAEADHTRDFQDFGVVHDIYYAVEPGDIQYYADELYHRIAARGRFTTKAVKVLYDPQKDAFLTGRLVEGTCPNCGDTEQSGDGCESCGALYQATDLVGPTSMLSDAPPVRRESEHRFFQLSKCRSFLKRWAGSGVPDGLLAGELAESLEEELADWDISCDAPYFGMEIPGEPGRCFAPGFSVPVSYMAAFDALSFRRRDLTLAQFWDRGSEAEVHHFVGKDDVDVHGILWPAMLDSAGYRTPTAVHAHGFIGLGGQKASRSHGGLIDARALSEHLPSDHVRYYLAARLGGADDDMNVDPTDFVELINSDLVAKLANMSCRCGDFIDANCDGLLADTIEATGTIDTMVQRGDVIADLYERMAFGEATREIMVLADQVNQYIDEHHSHPEGEEHDMQLACTVGLNLFRLLVIYLKPILPAVAARAESFLNIPALTFDDRHRLLVRHKINAFEPLASPVEMSLVAALVRGTAQVGAP